MRRFMGAVLLTVLCALAAVAPSARAFWIVDGTALCRATGTQNNPVIVSDGSGGAIVVWGDGRSGSSDIYVQRVNASGTVQWTTDGVAICTATGIQNYPMVVSDGSGGAIVTWHDIRVDGYDIYVQRVNASGAVQWAANGLALCTATGDQYYPTIVSDGAGGAIVTWYDFRSGNYDIYAQRVNASGAVQWAANGVALCTATGDQENPTIASDGAGGAIVTWHDYRSGNYDIYTQRVNASGVAQWTANGVAICTATGNQDYPAIVSDGAGGAIVTWEDYRSGNYDIYAQRVNSSGVAQWAANGVAICTATAQQYYPMIVSDGSGGAIMTWYDYRSGNYDIYAQRVNASGVAQWTANGVALCTATGNQDYPTIASDGSGGAIVSWRDYRSGNFDVYVQRVSASGVVQWAANGVAICTMPGDQFYPMIASDGAGGAIMTWYDLRSGSSDIYAQSIDAMGRSGYLAPSIYAVRDVPGDEGGTVYLSWYGARSDAFRTNDVTEYSIWRAIDPTRAAMAIDEGTVSSLESLYGRAKTSDKPVIRIERVGGLTYFWELVEMVDALHKAAYGKPLATLFDSTAVCTEHHYFQVVAHTADPLVFWESAVDSGYSVDNLAPSAPVYVAGEQIYVPAGLNLTWNRNVAADLGGYRVYRGLTEDFVPAEENLLGAPCDTIYFDGAWSWSDGYYYKVSAVDVHGNESGYALLRPEDVSGTESPKAPAASYLSQNFPNPFNPATRIAFGLSAPGRVSLRIYDAAGRLVRELVNETRAAARYEEAWDGRDGAQRLVASGIYFYRLDAGSFTQTRKMILLR